MNGRFSSAATGRRRAGFTLLEVSTAMGVILVLSVVLLVMLHQHAQFMELFRRQSFLAGEAPQIGNLLGRILHEADHCFVYADKDEALASGQPILTPGQAVKLFFKTPNQETVERLIVAEDTAAGPALRFYSWEADGTMASWTISDRIGGAEFQSDQGILNMTLEGPNGERVTYGGGVR